MTHTYTSFAAQAGVHAADRFMAADGSGQLELAAAAVTEVLPWWGIADEQKQAGGQVRTHDFDLAIRFARNCSAHRRISTHAVEGLGYPLVYPLRYDNRLFWRATSDVATGARGLGRSSVQQQRAAYDRLLAAAEVRPSVERVRSDLLLEVR